MTHGSPNMIGTPSLLIPIVRPHCVSVLVHAAPSASADAIMIVIVFIGSSFVSRCFDFAS